jgi:hypothetical protein
MSTKAEEIKAKKESMGYYDKPLYHRCRVFVNVRVQKKKKAGMHRIHTESLVCGIGGFPVKPNSCCDMFVLQEGYKLA